MYYLVKVKYVRNGERKPVTEQYLFETDSFASAEYAAIQAVQTFARCNSEEKSVSSAIQNAIHGDIEVKSISRMNVAKLIGDPFCLESQAQATVAEYFNKRKLSEVPDTWFKVRVAFITIDERTAREKRQTFIYLVHANTVDGAHKLAGISLQKSIQDYVIESVTETKILEVFSVEYADNNQ